MGVEIEKNTKAATFLETYLLALKEEQNRYYLNQSAYSCPQKSSYRLKTFICLFWVIGRIGVFCLHINCGGIFLSFAAAELLAAAVVATLLFA